MCDFKGCVQPAEYVKYCKEKLACFISVLMYFRLVQKLLRIFVLRK